MEDGYSARIGVLILDLFLPYSQSLKDKRRVIRSLIEKVRGKHNVSTAEVGYQDLHQRSSLAFVVVSSDLGVVDRILDAIVAESEREVPGHVSVLERSVVE